MSSDEVVEEKPMIKPYSEEELKKLAVDIENGLVFTNLHLTDQSMLNSVFMLLVFFTQEQMKKLEEEKVGLIFEYLSEAGPMAINGLPSFFSVRFLNESDTEKLRQYAKEYKNLKDSFLEKKQEIKSKI
jgi:hypothetical protein